MASDREPTEFGGQHGRIQRGQDGFTHTLTAAEQARMVRATDAADPTDSPEAAILREWAEEGKA